MPALKWTGTKQRDDLKTCPWCNTKAVQQVRLADSDTEMQFRIGCGNVCCEMEPNTEPYAALKDAEWAWQERELGDGCVGWLHEHPQFGREITFAKDVAGLEEHRGWVKTPLKAGA